MKIYYLVEEKRFSDRWQAMNYAEKLSMSMLDEVITIFEVINLDKSVFKRYRNGGEIG